MPNVETLEVNEAELLEDEEIIEEDEEVTEEEAKPKRTRKTLAEDNEYVFDTNDAAKNGKANLKYQDGTSVESYRVWVIGKGEYNADEKKFGEKTMAFVLAGTKSQACELLLESQDTTCVLASPKKQRGRAKTKIDATMLQFGKLLAFQATDGVNPDNGWKDGTPGHAKESWKKMFGVGGTHYHYRDDSGNWKEPTSE